jgi:hypothetical protein
MTAKHKIEVPLIQIDTNFKDHLAKSKRTSNCFKSDEEWIERFILKDFQSRYRIFESELARFEENPVGEAPQFPKRLTYTAVIRMAVKFGCEVLRSIEAHRQPNPSIQ